MQPVQLRWLPSFYAHDELLRQRLQDDPALVRFFCQSSPTWIGTGIKQIIISTKTHRMWSINAPALALAKPIPDQRRGGLPREGVPGQRAGSSTDSMSSSACRYNSDDSRKFDQSRDAFVLRSTVGFADLACCATPISPGHTSRPR